MVQKDQTEGIPNDPEEVDHDHPQRDFTGLNQSGLNPTHPSFIAGGKYHCPMHCEGDKTYSDPGHCPICGMDLVELTEQP